MSPADRQLIGKLKRRLKVRGRTWRRCSDQLSTLIDGLNREPGDSYEQWGVQHAIDSLRYEVTVLEAELDGLYSRLSELVYDGLEDEYNPRWTK